MTTIKITLPSFLNSLPSYQKQPEKPKNDKEDFIGNRDKLIKSLIDDAKQISEDIKGFKAHALSKIKHHKAYTAGVYGTKYGRSIYLTSSDKKYRIVNQVHDFKDHDERFAIGKSLIDKCLNKWIAQGVHEGLAAVIKDAFSVDKEGKISVPRVLSLKKHKIEDEDWKQAMIAIEDSFTISSTKEYLTFHEKKS